MPSLFETTQVRLQQAHGGGPRRGPAGQTQPPTNQAHSLHSAGMDSLQRNLASQQARAQERALQRKLQQQVDKTRVGLNSEASRLEILLGPHTQPFVRLRKLNLAQSRILHNNSANNKMHVDSDSPFDLEKLYRDLTDKSLEFPIFSSPNNTISQFKEKIYEKGNIYVDYLAIRSLKCYVHFRSGGIYYKDDSQKEAVFMTSSIQSTTIILDEFVSGSGKNDHYFYPNYRITKDFLKGYVIDDVLNGLYRAVNKRKMTYEKFLNLKKGENIVYGLAFSPDQTDTYWESAKRHWDSTAVQLMIGGAMIYVSPSKNMTQGADVEIVNSMSRHSFLLHFGKNYSRENVNVPRPLSTIRQHFVFSIRIDKNKFPKG